MEELKPCPFCGSLSIVKKEQKFKASNCDDWSDDIHFYSHTDYWAKCKKRACSANGPIKRSERGAVEAWNRRAK
jgi:hypothetical protein